MGNSMTSALLALVLVVPSFRCIAFGASSSADASTFDSNLSKGFPNNDPLSRRIPIPDKPSLEWTALGDSYASGVGTTKYQGGMRCLRFDEAYPQLINLDPYWSPGGDAAQDILDWQLLDNPTRFEPDITYGDRPAFGLPEFATLSAGGDDIDFPGMLFNCILGVHITGGPVKRTCTDQQTFTWGLLNNGKYIDDLGRVIDAIMQKGRQGPKGNDFRLYLTGYGRFFNADTTGSDTNCDKTTFQVDGFITKKPIGPKGAADAMLTQALRKNFNNMADSLNSGIQRAVATYNDPHVKFVDIQTDPLGRDILAGHRFCEKGIQEPDLSNSNSFIWHFPYSGANPVEANSTTVALNNIFETAYTNTWNEAGPDINAKYPKYNQFFSAVLDHLTPDLFQANGISDWEHSDMWGPLLGDRARIFHPQFKWHESITTSILTQYVLDNGPPDATSNSPSTSSSIPVPTQGCQSPNHDQPLVPFTLSQGEGALGGFIGQCQSEFQPGGIDGCTLYYNPCSQDNGAQAIDVILSVQQWTWADGTTSTWPDVQEMNDAISEIMNNCDTTTVTEKWGGFKSVQTANGIRMYNVTANQNGQYPTNTGFGMVSITSGGWDCPDWDST